MIRKQNEQDLCAMMQIWLDANRKAHHFIDETYWNDNYETVRNALPKAEVFVYEDDTAKSVQGFIGLTDHHIQGLFVREDARSKGIGRQLMDYAKDRKPKLTLYVYQKNERAVRFYQREGFFIQSENWDEALGEKELLMCWNR